MTHIEANRILAEQDHLVSTSYKHKKELPITNYREGHYDIWYHTHNVIHHACSVMHAWLKDDMVMVSLDIQLAQEPGPVFQYCTSYCSVKSQSPSKRKSPKRKPITLSFFT